MIGRVMICIEELRDLRAKQGVAVLPSEAECDEFILSFVDADNGIKRLPTHAEYDDWLRTNTRHITAEELESVRNALKIYEDACSINDCEEFKRDDYGLREALVKINAILDRIKGE